MSPLPMVSRRQLLTRSGMGIGGVALAGLLCKPAAGESASPAAPTSALGPRPPHFKPRAVRIIHLFMNGGPSQIDLFDPKPLLKKYEGKVLKDDLKADKRIGGVGLPSPFAFAKHGQSGIEISELLPNIARHADDLCVIR